jgi:hypothetical protein
MNHRAAISLRLANERIADAIRLAAIDRLNPSNASLRRAVGRSIIRIGERLAAEPSLRPAQPSQG